jgi:nitrogen regulatory protein P-II 2
MRRRFFALQHDRHFYCFYFKGLAKAFESGTPLECVSPVVALSTANEMAPAGGQARRMGNQMKIVMAIIKPFKLDEVREALTAVGIQGLTVTEVKGYGRQKGHTEIYRGTEYAVSFLPKLKIEIAVPVDVADKAVEAIASAAKTGQIGDGKIFVYSIDHAVRIRTGETDSEAL